MGTKIEWAEETWNPITGCSKISPGCKNCYAERMARRLAGRHGYPEAPNHFDVTFHPDKLEQPLHWRKPRQVFVCSMGDLFHPDVPVEWQVDVWKTMLECPQHTFMVLTKRPNRMAWFVGLFYGRFDASSSWPPANIWLGVTVCNQDEMPKVGTLLSIPAAKRFISFEPLLSIVDLREYLFSTDEVSTWRPLDYGPGIDGPKPDWIICGAETGPGARPMHLDWARSLRDQCQLGKIPFFYKSNGEWMQGNGYPGDFTQVCWMDRSGKAHIPEETAEWPEGTATFWRVGKQRTGRKLDGRLWEERPE